MLITPADLHPEAWYDASQSSNVTLVSGRVSVWRDVSGRHRHGEMKTSTWMPFYDATLGGLPAIRFDPAISTNMRLNVDQIATIFRQTAGATICAVCQSNALVNQNIFRVESSSSGHIRHGLFFSSTGFRRLDSDIYVSLQHSPPPATGTDYVLSSVIDYAAGTVKAYRNGAQVLNGAVSTGLTSDTNSLSGYIGNASGGQGFDGLIGEIIVFRNALSDDDRGFIESYLSGKWGLSFSVMVTLSGVATKQGGLPADNVVILSHTTHETGRILTPDAEGVWSTTLPPAQYDILYLADGCAPVCHGPYTVTAQ